MNILTVLNICTNQRKIVGAVEFGCVMAENQKVEVPLLTDSWRLGFGMFVMLSQAG